MKLAEALILRADLQRKIEQMKYRLQNNVMIQEGDKPSEDPYELMKELDGAIDNNTELIKQINKTNSSTMFDEKWTLTDALAERDKIRERIKYLTDIVDSGTVKFDRYSRSEIRYVSFVDVTKIQRDVDNLSKKWRELDTKIQGMNWTIDLK